MSTADNLPQTAGTYELDAGPHSYTLYLPPKFDPSRTYPLAVCLHYAGYDGAHYGRGLLESTVIAGLRQLNPIVVAPDSRSWVSQIGAMSALAATELALTNYSIDRKRILLTGFSMGGGGTWFLGAQKQNLFTALLPMAAFPREDSAESNWTIPILALNSTADELFTYAEAQRRVAQLEAAGANIKLVTLDGVSHYRPDLFAEPIHQALPWLLQQWE